MVGLCKKQAVSAAGSSLMINCIPCRRILRKFHTYNISKQGLQVNETCRDLTNPICDVLMHTNNIYSPPYIGSDN
jgi:hypothetical protein